MIFMGEFRLPSKTEKVCDRRLYPTGLRAKEKEIDLLIMKVFAACDDFDSEKQPPACAFPCVLCAPCVLCGEGFWLRLRRAAFQGFGPGFGYASIALRFKV